MKNWKLFLPLSLIVVLLMTSKSSKAAVSKALVQIKGTPTGPSWTRFDPLYQKYGAQYGIDWKLLKAIALNESLNGTYPSVALGLREPANEDSVSDDGLSYGLMQVTLTTAQDFRKNTTMEDLNNPEIAVEIAAKFFQWAYKQFPNDSGETQRKKVVMSYNQGVAGTQKGRTAALPYYERFLTNYAKVQAS
jgi:membrane-bound lytic murein transglycosylase MltF